MPLCYLRAWLMNVCSSWKLVDDLAEVGLASSLDEDLFWQTKLGRQLLKQYAGNKNYKSKLGCMGCCFFLVRDQMEGWIGCEPCRLRYFDAVVVAIWVWTKAVSRAVLHQMDVVIRELVGKLLGHHKVWTGQAMARSFSLLEWVGGRCDAAVWD
jgi:hypothetical protein